MIFNFEYVRSTWQARSLQCHHGIALPHIFFSHASPRIDVCRPWWHHPNIPWIFRWISGSFWFEHHNIWLDSARIWLAKALIPMDKTIRPYKGSHRMYLNTHQHRRVGERAHKGFRLYFLCFSARSERSPNAKTRSVRPSITSIIIMFMCSSEFRAEAFRWIELFHVFPNNFEFLIQLWNFNAVDFGPNNTYGAQTKEPLHNVPVVLCIPCVFFFLHMRPLANLQRHFPYFEILCWLWANGELGNPTNQSK